MEWGESGILVGGGRGAEGGICDPCGVEGRWRSRSGGLRGATTARLPSGNPLGCENVRPLRGRGETGGGDPGVFTPAFASLWRGESLRPPGYSLATRWVAGPAWEGRLAQGASPAGTYALHPRQAMQTGSLRYSRQDVCATLKGGGCHSRFPAVARGSAVREHEIPAKGLSGNNLVNLPWSFAAELRCSLVTDREGYAPHSRLAVQQNPGGILANLFPDRP
jgi:hypothetical protein